MHKTTTLKDIKVFVLKTFLTILVLGISFQVAIAQDLLSPNRKANQKLQTQAVPVAPQLTKQMVKDNPSLMPSQATPTDVPAYNLRYAEKMSRITSTNTPPTNRIVDDVCVFNGGLVAGDLTLTAGRFFRDGVPSTCAAPKACPGPFGTGPYYYDTYAMSNQTCAPQCVTINYIANAGGGDVFGVVYLGAFNPASLCTNYLADGGSSSLSGGTSVTFSFNLAAGANITIVLMGAQISTACPSYTMTVTGLLCTPPPACTPIGPSVLSQTTYAAPPVSLLTEGFNFNTPYPANATPPGWNSQYLSQPLGLITVWYSGVVGVFPAQAGASYIAANYNHAGAALGTLSSWLITPALAMKNGDKFSFYTRHDPGNARPDRLQVRLNTTTGTTNVGATATSVGDFTTLLLDINPTYQTTGYPTVWQQYTLTISGLPPAGIPNGRVAFRYFCENSGGVGVGINSDYIGIDEFNYQTFPQVLPQVCVGGSTCLKVDIAGGNPGATYNVVINAAPATPGYPRTINGYTSGDCIPVSPIVNTTYNLVSVIDASNPCCIGTGNSGTPLVTVAPGPISSITIQDNPTGPLCAGDPKLLTVIGTPGVGNFTNPANIVINSNAITQNNLVVAGVPVGVSTLQNVIINGFSHTWSGDVNMVLQSPTGQNVILKGNSQADPFIAATNVTLTYSDAAVGSLPLTSPMASGTYKPTNYNASPFSFLAPGPANVVTPVFPASPTLATFVGDFNGTWKLFVEDRVGGDQGNIAGGFTLNFAFPPAAPPVGWTWLWSPAAGLSSTTSNPTAASPMTTRQYTVLGTAPGGCQTVATILITVNQLPAVVTQPAASTICTNGNTTFTVAGTGAGLTYQWQVSTTGCGGAFVNITNGGVYTGATTGTLTITGAPFTMNGYAYRCVLSGTCPPAVNSNCVLLTVNALPTVTIAPASPVCGGVAGTSGTALTASGATGTYVWSPLTGLYNNANGTGAYTGTNQATVYAAPAVNTVYTVTGTNAGTGCINTATVNVVYTPPPPTVNPPSVTMCNGDAAVQLCVISSLAPSPFTTTYSSGPINVLVPDNTPSGATSTINAPLPATAQITNMRVIWNMSHTWDGDMVFALKAPNGQILNLDYLLSITGGTGPTTGFVNTTISSTGVNALSTGANPYTGTFKADAVLTNVNAGIGGPTGYAPTVTTWPPLYSTPNGNWILAMKDAFGGDEGTLTSWSISFDYLYGPPAAGTWSPATGLYTDAAATIPYIAGTPATCVYTRPLPSGVYPYNVTVTSVGFDQFPVFNNPAAITISDNVCSSNNLVVAGLPVTGVSVDKVNINSFSHTWSGDVNIALQSPTGQNLILKGNSVADPLIAATNVNLVFSDGAAGSLPLTSPMASGTYLPTNRNGATFAFLAPGPTVTGPTFPASPQLSSFTGNFNGTWKLFVEDRVGGDVGSISGGFGVTFKYATVGCTSAPRVVNVTVNTPATITLQPLPQNVCTDKVATFTVAASGSGPITYQWEVSTDNGNTYNPITNGGVYSGATTTTLTITAPPVTMSGYVYRCKVQPALPCPAIYSFFRFLTVYPLPTITITPLATKLFPGMNVTLTSAVSPVAAATYTWYRDGVVVTGATGPTLYRDVDGFGVYTLKVTDINGCTNLSNTATISDSVSTNCFLYPNPNSGKFQVRYHSVAGNVLPRSVTVYNVNGVRVSTQFFNVIAPYARMDLDLRPYGKGVYWVEIGDLNGSRLQMCRVVVQ